MAETMWGKRTKRLRKDFGWSELELAKKIGMVRGTILRIERGAGCQASTLVKLAAVFHVEPKVFLEPLDD